MSLHRPSLSPAPRRRTARTAFAVLTAAALLATGWAPVALAAPTGLSEPVLDLPFEGSTVDGSALAHPVTVKGHNGSPAQGYAYVDGVADGTQALALSGNTYLDLGTSTALQPESMSLSFWLKPTGVMTGEQVISWNKGAYNTDGWYLSSESNTSPLALSVGPASGQPYKVRVATSNRASFFPAGEWTHVVVTYDAASKTVSFYRNGEQVPTTVANAYGPGGATGVLGSDAALPKTIGFNGPVYNGAYLQAGLDQYRLYDSVATLSDVVGLYEESGREIDRQAIAQEDADSLTLPERVSVALILSTVGSRGSTISWESSDPGRIATDGTVNRPAEGENDAHVTLTATVRYLDGDAVTREFDLVVPAQAPVDPLEDSGIPSVLLSDDFLNNAAAKEQEYLLSLSSEKFLYEFYRVAGLEPTTASGYGGWERSNAVNFRGHTFGHYMSALAMSYQSTRDETVRDGLYTQLEDAVSGLGEVQDAYAVAHPDSAGYVSAFRESILDEVQGTGTSDENVIVPWYILHKVLAGLLDIDTYVDGPVGDQAAQIAHDLGVYVYDRISKLASTDVMLRTEYGGMNDALYDLFARTGDVRIKKAAEAFDETTLFQQLAAGQDVLAGKHANTTIPKLLGALKRYTVFTQNPEYYELLTPQEKDDLPMYLAAAENFFDIVVDHHTYVTGANSQSEHFHDPDSLFDLAANQGAHGNAETAETCNEYNMLKLSRELFKISKDVRYADYYENTFINTILSSQNPETGTTTYFNAMAPGYHKVFNMPFTEFWCCTGTGMENFSKLGDSIYFTGSSTVWVNMFFSSRFDYAEQNLRLTQTANMPDDDTVTLDVAGIDGGEVADGTAVRLRVPDWIAGEPVVTVNGATIEPTISRGYVVLSDVKAGDQISYTMPMDVTVHDTPDNENFVAFKYGPVVLSAGLGTHDIDGSEGTGILVRVSSFDPNAQTTITTAGMTAQEWTADVAENVVRIENSPEGDVQFVLKNTADAEDLVYIPHYKRHAERYGIYMNLESADSQAAQDRILRAKEEERAKELTVDSLMSFDNNNFENAKNVKSSSSGVGVYGGRQYRDATAGGWFSYDLMLDVSSEQNVLGATYFSGDRGRRFDVYLNDERLKTVTVTDQSGHNDEAGFYVDATEIPQKYLQIDDGTRYKTDSSGDFVLDEDGEKIPVVTVRFQSTGGLVGGLFGVQIDRAPVFDDTPELSGLGLDTGTLDPAFSPETKEYTLRVAEGTTSVTLDADPHLPSGLVRVDGVLIDDTKGRPIALPVGGEPRTVEVTAVAQDHTTSTTYTLTVVQGEPTASVDLSVEVSPRCMAGKVYLAVQAKNVGDVPASVTLSTPFGTKTFAEVAPGKAAYQSFAVRSATAPAGSVTVTGAAVVDGEEATTPYGVAYDAFSCLAG